MADETRAQVIPSMRTVGSDSKRATGTILVLMVSATRPPTPMAPANSHIVANTMACLRVTEWEETDVAQEFATSFAP